MFAILIETRSAFVIHISVYSGHYNPLLAQLLYTIPSV